MIRFDDLNSEENRYFHRDDRTDRHRRVLPHWQQGSVWVFVTWRLGDSLPREMLDQLKVERENWLQHHPLPWDEEAETAYHDNFSRQLDHWLDQGKGSCLLKEQENAVIVSNAFKHFNGERYDLGAYVVMPNHVHVLFRPYSGHAIEAIIRAWKGYTSRMINQRIGRSGPLWQKEYWDRLVRNQEHFYKLVEYIRENPLKAQLKEDQFIFELLNCR